MSEPENFDEPYSEVTDLTLINMKSRQVYCRYCVYVISTDLCAPKCGICHAPLLTYVQSHFKDELVG